MYHMGLICGFVLIYDFLYIIMTSPFHSDITMVCIYVQFLSTNDYTVLPSCKIAYSTEFMVLYE